MYNQKFGSGLPKRPKGTIPTSPFGLNTPTRSRPDSWFFGASMAGDWLEAACRFDRGAMPLKIALALQHEAMFRGSPVDIELKSGKGSGNLRIREQFGTSGSGYNTDDHDKNPLSVMAIRTRIANACGESLIRSSTT